MKKLSERALGILSMVTRQRHGKFFEIERKTSERLVQPPFEARRIPSFTAKETKPNKPMGGIDDSSCLAEEVPLEILTHAPARRIPTVAVIPQRTSSAAMLPFPFGGSPKNKRVNSIVRRQRNQIAPNRHQAKAFFLCSLASRLSSISEDKSMEDLKGDSESEDKSSIMRNLYF